MSRGIVRYSRSHDILFLLDVFEGLPSRNAANAYLSHPSKRYTYESFARLFRLGLAQYDYDGKRVVITDKGRACLADFKKGAQ